MHRSASALVIIAAAFLTAAPAAHAQSNWTGATSANWSVSSNWTGGVPNAAGAIAQYSGSSNASTTVDTGNPETVGTITLGGSSGVSWTITPTAGLTLSGTTSATISNIDTSTSSTNALILSTGTITLTSNLTISNTNAGNTNTTGSVQIIGTLLGTGNLTINNAVTAISQTGSIRFQSGLNAFTGTVLIQAGTTSYNSAFSFGDSSSNTITLGASGFGSAALISTTTGINLPNNIIVASGSGGTLTLGSVSTSSSATTIYSGTVLLNGGLSMTSLNGTGGSTTISGVISGSGILTKVGSGVATLSNTGNTYASTNISAGTLIASAAGALGTGAVVNNATLNLTGGAVAYTFGAVSGAGITNITLSTGSNSTTFTNATWASYTGTLNVGVSQSSGAGKAAINAALPATATVNVTANSTLYVDANVTDSAPITLNGGTTGEAFGQLRMDLGTWAGPVTLAGTIAGTGNGYVGANTGGSGTISGTIGGTGPLSKAGPGTIALTGALSNYTGGVTLNAGTLNLGVAQADATGPLGASVAGVPSGSITFAGGTLQFSSANTVDYSGIIADTASAISIDTNGQSVTFAAALGSGKTGGLTKLGAGTLTLSSTANAYAGTTAINAGILKISAAGALPSTATVAFTNTTGTAALDITGLSQTIANLTFATQTTGTNTVTITGNSSTSLTASPTALTIAPSSTTSSVLTLDMSTLNSFIYNKSTGTIVVGSASASTSSTTWKFPTNTTLTAASFTAGPNGLASGPANVTLTFGQNVTLNASSIALSVQKYAVSAAFASGLTAPSLTLQGTGGTGTYAALTLGQLNDVSANSYSNTLNTTPGTIAAYLSSALIGNASSNASSGRESINSSLFTIGSGTVQITGTMTLGQLTGTAGTNIEKATGTFSMNGASVYVNTITFGDAQVSETGSGSTATGIFNLTSGSLYAGTIQSGASVSATTRTFNWSSGTVGNLPGDLASPPAGLTAANLSISGVSIVLAGASATHAFNISASQTGTVTSIISGTGPITKLGSGTLALNGANTFAATSTVSTIQNGTVLIGISNSGSTSGAFGPSANTVSIGAAASGGALLTNGAFTFSNPVQILSNPASGSNSIGGNTDNNSTFSGPILLAGDATVSQVANAGSNALSLTGGLGSNNPGTQTITFAGPGNITVSGAAITNGTAGIIAVAIAGGVTTFTTTNTYTGPTTINGGTLRINGDNTAATGAVTVNAGTLRGNGIIGGAVTVANGGTIRAGNATDTLTLKAGLAVASGGTLAIEIADGSTPSASPGGSTTGTLPSNPLSNNFYAITGGTTTIDPAALLTVAIDSGASFTAGSNYSYQIASGAGDQSNGGNPLLTASQITFTGNTGPINPASATLTGDSSGDIYLNFTASVPEPTMLIGLAVITLLALRKNNCTNCERGVSTP